MRRTIPSEYKAGYNSACRTIIDYGLVWTMGYFIAKMDHYPYTLEDNDRPLIKAYWQGYANRLMECKYKLA